MEKITCDWTQNELKAYILLYAAQTHYHETSKDREKIISLVSADIYNKIHKELDKDNDFQSIEKILCNIKKFNYTKNDIEMLINEIKDLFISEGEFDRLEEYLLIVLKRVLSS